MQDIEVTGKNIEEAVKEGLKQLQCTKDEIEIKVLDEGTSGLFGLMGSKPAKVLISKKEVSEVSDENEEKNQKSLQNLQNVNPDTACKNVEQVLKDILSIMKVEIKDIKVSYDNGFVNAEFSSDSGSLLIGRGGQTLDALEYVTQLMINTNPETRVKVNLDTEGYRLKQHDKIKTLIQKAIEYVNRTKKIYRFDPMSAKDRKFIHNYFKDMPEFETFSEGTGSMRKVGVKISANK